MALVRNYVLADSPKPRRGHVGWTCKRKAYFSGGYTEVLLDRTPFNRRSQLLRDIHCLDLDSMTWLADSPFPAPPDYLDGHTVSMVGTKLYIIAGGTYPAGHDPNLGFSLACSPHVYILETNPPCNPNGTLPALEWRKLRLIQETVDDADHHRNLGDEEGASSDEEAGDFFVEEDGGDNMEVDEDILEEDDEDEEGDFSDEDDDIEADELFNPVAGTAGFATQWTDEAAPSNAAQDPAMANPSPTRNGLAGMVPSTLARAWNAAAGRLLPTLGGFGKQSAPSSPPSTPQHWNSAPAMKLSQDPAHYLKPRVWHSATVVGTRIYIMGGRDMHLRYFDDVTYFDTLTETFVRVKLAPGSEKLPPRAAHGAVCPDGRHIYVFGGRYKYSEPHNGLTHKHYNDVWVFDTRHNTWKLLIDPPELGNEKYMKTPVNRFYAPATDNDATTTDEVDSDSEQPKTSTTAGGSASYPAPRCCFLMVLDPALPHKAHIVGGYTSSNVCFYYIGDSWTLDLLELSWTPMTFLPGSHHLNRVSIHTPTSFYDELLLFAGEGSRDIAEVPYGSQQFLPHTTIFTVPDTPMADVLRYRDPLSYHYFQLFHRQDLSDVSIEIQGGTLRLHRVICAARMKSLNKLLATSGTWSASLSSSLRSSQKFEVRSCTINNALWEQFLTRSLPEGFQDTFPRPFTFDVLTKAMIFAYTDSVHNIHRVPLEELVQLYHLGHVLSLKRLSAVALLQIGERLDPYFPKTSDVPLIGEMIAVSTFYRTELDLIDVLIWFQLNATPRDASAGVAHRGITVLPNMVLPVPDDMSRIHPQKAITNVANKWLSLDGTYSSLSVAMESLYLASENTDADFELSVVPPPPAETAESSTSSFNPFPTQPLRVHKSILIFCSPYLNALLSNDFKESQQGFATIQDLPYPMERESLDALVRFMYSGSSRHIQDKNSALDILCNVQFFYSQHQELSKPIPHLGERSTRLLRPRILAAELMAHCIDVILSGDVTEAEVSDLLQLATTLRLLHLEQRLKRFSNQRQRRVQAVAAP